MPNHSPSKHPARDMGYGLTGHQYLPVTDEEKTLRDVLQWRLRKYRDLKSGEIDQLQQNGNFCPDWSQVIVCEQFNPKLVHRCRFYGFVRIGVQESVLLEVDGVKHHVGLYDSVIISSDIGDNCCVDRVGYLAHYIVGDLCVLQNIGRVLTRPRACFGQGVVKQGRSEQDRIWLNLGNENGGRRILPFEGMLPADASFWSRWREDDELQEKLIEFTNNRFDSKPGYYGTIGDDCVIRNTQAVEDSAIGHNAYIDGADLICNTTLSSVEAEPTAVCARSSIQDSIVGLGARIGEGVKLRRSILGPSVSLDLGARVTDSYIADNSTINCCEVANSLILPFHEQHHNNSFLIAGTLGGQTNIAAGATLGSNHNSRAADGELFAGRGFWPGLCSSFKYPSRFAPFVLVAKGHYGHELNIPTPFSLLSQSSSEDALLLSPAWMFLHNMYAVMRNQWKFARRDKRKSRRQPIEINALAPDTIAHVLSAIALLETWTGIALLRADGIANLPDVKVQREKGRAYLQGQESTPAELDLQVESLERSRRLRRVLKPVEAFHSYRRMAHFYAIRTMVEYMALHGLGDPEALVEQLGRERVRRWVMLGGQPTPLAAVDQFRREIKEGSIDSWNDLHEAYADVWSQYPEQKARHALDTLVVLADNPDMDEESETLNLDVLEFDAFSNHLKRAAETQQFIVEQVVTTRAKDSTDPFRRITYTSQEEMDAVQGKLEDNPFIVDMRADAQGFIDKVEQLLR